MFDGKKDKLLTKGNCRIVLPTAPKAPVSLNDGYEMNSWFDMHAKDRKSLKTLEEIRSDCSQPDLVKSAKFLLKLIEEEKAKLNSLRRDASNIIIGGFG